MWVTISGNAVFIENVESMSREFYETQTKEKHKEKVLLEKIENMDDKKALSKLKKYEKLIVDEEGENAIAITKNGEIYRCFGNRTNVWPDTDINPQDIMYLTHNHPLGEGNHTFGNEDKELFKKNKNIKVLRGISSNYTYEFTRLNNLVDEIPSLGEGNDDISVHIENIEFAKTNGYGYTRKERKQNKTMFIF